MRSNFMELGQEVAVAFYQTVGRRKWRKPQALAERRAQAEAAEATSPRGAYGESSKLQLVFLKLVEMRSTNQVQLATAN